LPNSEAFPLTKGDSIGKLWETIIVCASRTGRGISPRDNQSHLLIKYLRDIDRIIGGDSPARFHGASVEERAGTGRFQRGTGLGEVPGRISIGVHLSGVVFGRAAPKKGAPFAHDGTKRSR